MKQPRHDHDDIDDSDDEANDSNGDYDNDHGNVFFVVSASA